MHTFSLPPASAFSPLLGALLLSCTGYPGNNDKAGDTTHTNHDTDSSASDTAPPLDTDVGEPLARSLSPADRPELEVVNAKAFLTPQQECKDPDNRSIAPYFEYIYPTIGATHPWILGGGLIVGDFDGNGALEVWVTTEHGLFAFAMVGDRLVQMAAPTFDTTGGSGGVTADYDGDGDLDVYVTRWEGWPGPENGEEGKNQLLRNDGAQGFTDVTESAGGLNACVDRDCLRSTTSSFGDFDRDGDLDLFVGSHGYLDKDLSGTEQGLGEPTFLYENLGDGTFRDISDTLPDEAHIGYTLAGGFFDMNDDGWVELYIVNDIGRQQPNIVMWNDEGTLRFDPYEASGLTIATSCMGVGMGDFNNDLRPDPVIPDWGNLFYVESAAALDLWVVATAIHGIVLTGTERVGWGTDIADLDNDGDLDIVSQAGFLEDFGNPNWISDHDQPDLVFQNVGTPSSSYFVEVANEWGLDDPNTNRGVALVDMNRDGYIDVLRHNLNGTLRAYMSNCGTNSWLRVKLRQEGDKNPDAIGARIIIEDDGERWVRWISAGGTSIGVGLPPEAHFGLGDREVLDRVEVRWPDGAVSEVRQVRTRRELTLVRD